MAFSNHPTHLALLDSAHQGPYPLSTGYTASSNTTLSNGSGAGKYTHEEKQEWDDDTEETGASYGSKSRSGLQKTRNCGLSFMRISCYILHFFLVAIHGGLIVTARRTHSIVLYEVLIEDEVTVNNYLTMRAMLAQTITIIYLTLLVYLTQQISLRRNISAKQTLTAVHDKYAAWTGLGSAFASLWLQMTVRASVVGVTLITLYLSGVAILKVSTPNLLAIVPYNTTVNDTIQTDLNNPFLTVPNRTWINAGSSLPFMSQLPTTGLYSNVLFDFVHDSNGTGTTTVNSSTINVKCRALGGVNMPANIYPGATNKWVASLPVQEANVLQVYIGNLSAMARNTLQIFSNPIRVGETENSFVGPNIIIDVSTNIEDSSGNSQPGEVLWNSANRTEPLAYLQAIGCSLDITNQTSNVDVQTKQLVIPPVQPNSSTWSPWQPKPSTDIWLLSAWPTMMSLGWFSQITTMGQYYHHNNDLGNIILPPFLSVTEVAIMNEVKMLLSSDFSPDGIRVETKQVPVKLHDLENALAIVTASMFWSVAHIGGSDLETSQAPTGVACIQREQLAARLQMGPNQVIFGFITSVIVLGLAMCMVGLTGGAARPTVESAGILHVFWLSAMGSMARKRIARVDKPTTRSLRKAGMFKVIIADGRTDIDEDSGSLMKAKK